MFQETSYNAIFSTFKKLKPNQNLKKSFQTFKFLELFFFNFIFTNFFSSTHNECQKRKPENVFLSCLLYHLSMNEIIISHEKISSENKNIIGTSIFIMAKASRNNFYLNFYSFRCWFASFEVRAVQLAAFSCLFVCLLKKNEGFYGRELLLSCY